MKTVLLHHPPTKARPFTPSPTTAASTLPHHQHLPHLPLSLEQALQEQSCWTGFRPACADQLSPEFTVIVVDVAGDMLCPSIPQSIHHHPRPPQIRSKPIKQPSMIWTHQDPSVLLLTVCRRHHLHWTHLWWTAVCLQAGA